MLLFCDSLQKPTDLDLYCVIKYGNLYQQSDWLTIRSGCGIFIYSAGQGLKVDPKKAVSEQKCINYTEKWTFMFTFLYHLYSFVWLQHGCLANTVFALALAIVL